MSGLKELKIRINSVTSTGKITKAMQLVAASKLRKAGEAATVSRPFFRHTLKVLGNLTANYKEVENNKFLSDDGNNNYVLFVLTSDKGLCGGFNSSIIKKTLKRVKELQADKKKVSIVCVGKKSVAQISSSPYRDLIIKTFTDNKKAQIEFAKELRDYAIELVKNSGYNKCEFIYNKFISPLIQEPENMQIIPFNVNDVAAKFDVKFCQSEFTYEPRINKLLDIVIPKALLGIIRHFLLESFASEQASRMTAMDSANKNASEMIEKLTLVLNRSRQALITKELIEIISGAEAV